MVEVAAVGASLYGLTSEQKHVCMLVKHLGGKQFSVDAKASEADFLAHLLKEIEADF